MSQTSVKARILLSEEDPNLLDILKSLFRSLGHRVKTVSDSQTLADALGEEHPDILLCSCNDWNRLPDDRRKTVPVIVTAPYAEFEHAAQAVRNGAAAMLAKPVRAQNAIDAINRILETRAPAPPDNPPEPDDPDTVEPERHFGTLIGEHPAMRDLYQTIERVAQTTLAVLIRGESGVGKDLVARAIHDASPRAQKPFIAINCTAVPANLLESELFGHVRGAFTGALKAKDGLFTAADGGTVFLDEIGSIPVPMQLSLLRVLQDHSIRPVGATQARTVDVRVVAATNENLEQRIRDGLFREDLFFRLAAFPVAVPPLREHPEDIPLLARAFLKQHAETAGKHLSFTPDALKKLATHPWQGNIRELKNAVVRSAALLPDAARISPADLALPDDTPAAQPDRSDSREPVQTLKAYLRTCERDYLRTVLKQCRGDKEQAAALLGISIGTFYRKYEP